MARTGVPKRLVANGISGLSPAAVDRSQVVHRPGARLEASALNAAHVVRRLLRGYQPVKRVLVSADRAACVRRASSGTLKYQAL